VLYFKRDTCQYPIGRGNPLLNLRDSARLSSPYSVGVYQSSLNQAQNSTRVHKPETHVNTTQFKPMSLNLFPPQTQPQPQTSLKVRGNDKEAALRIFSWNAHSLSSRVKQLFIQSRSEDIICVQETWGAQLEALQELPNNVYSVSRRLDHRGGGSLTLLKNSIQVNQTYAVNKDSNLLRTIIHGNKILWICNLYLNQGKVCQIKSFQESA